MRVSAISILANENRMGLRLSWYTDPTKRRGSLRNLHRATLSLLFLIVLVSDWDRKGSAQEQKFEPKQIVRQTVESEIAASSTSLTFMFRSRKQTAGGSQTKLLVQTHDATAGMLIAINDQPLTPEQRQAEEGRLQHLIHNPAELKRKQKQEAGDADRVQRIVRALPDAFLYEFDGTENGRTGMGKEGDELIRLKFRPNPNYDPPSRVEQVLIGMQGILFIDAKRHRIARIDGTLFRDVSFGWGILGHLDKGGHFEVDQGNVADDGWEITHMGLNFTGKVLLVKSIAIKAEEQFSDFRRVPTSLSFAEGVALLKKQQSAGKESRSEENRAGSPPFPSRHAHSLMNRAGTYSLLANGQSFD